MGPRRREDDVVLVFLDENIVVPDLPVVRRGIGFRLQREFVLRFFQLLISDFYRVGTNDRAASPTCD